MTEKPGSEYTGESYVPSGEELRIFGFDTQISKAEAVFAAFWALLGASAGGGVGFAISEGEPVVAVVNTVAGALVGGFIGGLSGLSGAVYSRYR